MTHNQFLMRGYYYQGLPTTTKEQNLCQGVVGVGCSLRVQI